MHPLILLVALLATVKAPACLCFYYGPINSSIVSWLESCPGVVLPPGTPPELVERLSSRGVTVLAYISITTVGGWEPWAEKVPGDIIIGRSEWGERIVNACSAEWAAIVEDAARQLLRQGYSGFFLDNLDMVDEYPWMAECVAKLVKMLRESHPGAVIAVNRGFTILSRIAPYIDILVVESFPTYYDRGSREYRVWSGSDLEWILAAVEKALRLSRRYGFHVMAIAYTPPGDWSMACEALERLNLSIPVYAAPFPLQAPGACNPCGAPPHPPETRHTARANVARFSRPQATPAETRALEEVRVHAPSLHPLLILAAAAAVAFTVLTLVFRRMGRR